MKQTFVFFSAMMVMLVSCDNKKAQPAPGARPYPVVEVEKRDVISYSYYPVKIQGTNNNDVRAKISGYIREVYVDEGQVVKKGQPLFRLETNMLNESAEAARAGITAAAANVDAAKASLNAAKVEVDKLIPLVEKKIISNVQLETAKANYMRVEGQLKQAEAAYAQAKSNYNSVQANIGYSVITSPINGTVGLLPFKVGSLVGPTDPTPLTTVSDTKEVYAYFSMNEAEYLNFLSDAEGKDLKEKIENFLPVELELANGNVYTEKGKIETVSGQINPTSGTVQFRVAFPNGGQLLSNGSSGKIRIPKQLRDKLVIPESATFENQGVIYVYSLKGDTAVSVMVDLITRVNNMAVVESGVKEGDKIVAAGVGTLRNNSAITPQPVKLDSLLANIKTKFK
ncbi:MAG TPA: efflux RND transporter periplasmic adaptor subunit [Ferruginibacter sp.]|nr:efflux RND transporter periplasmic adaptor subunit [Ferruginibacter sp.]HRO17770.1 efflux RND transporter periplasmic adaptor subunit [Ferruginibacter sp.]